MNLQQQSDRIKELFSKCEELMLNKGDDYAQDDRLSNFKMAGAICGLTPQQQCLSLIATKVARLGVLLGGKTPKNESISDSMVDLVCYATLLYLINTEDK